MPKKSDKKKELTSFQIRNIEILSHMVQHDAFDFNIVQKIRSNEMDFFSLVNKIELLERSVNIDQKTQLLRYNKNYLTQIVKTASRIYHGMDEIYFNISLIRFDIDDFTKFNNLYGHDFGDKILVHIAGIFKKNTRPTDYIIRFGGEEFDILLPATSLDGAVRYAKKIQEKVRHSYLKHNKKHLKVRLSSGVSWLQYKFKHEMNINEKIITNMYGKLQQEADNALYEAKYLGKNRICVFSEDKHDEYLKIRKLYVK